MKKCYIMAPNGEPSVLEKELLRVFKNQKDADSFYKKLQSPKFLKKFGDWKKNYKNLEGPATKEMGVTYPNGEPMLKKVDGAEQYYVELADGTLFFANKRGLRAEFTQEEIRDVSKYFLFKYVNYGGIESFNNMDTKDGQSKMMVVVEKSISDLRAQIERIPGGKAKRILNRRLSRVEKYKDEFRSRLTYELDSLGQKFKEGDLESVDGIEALSGLEEIVASESDSGVVRKESVTVNPKDTATVNTKILLSQLQSFEINPDTKTKERVLSKFLRTPVYEDFDNVWDSLQRLLTDNAPAFINNGVVSSYEKMLGILKDVSDIYPWAQDLVSRLETMYKDDASGKNKVFEFVQAFSKTKLNYYITEFNRANSAYTVYNATSTNSRESQILDSWGIRFGDIFLENYGVPNIKSEDNEKIRKIGEDVNAIHFEFTNLLGLAGKNKEKKISRDLKNEAILYATENLFKSLRELGVFGLEISDINKLIFIGGGVQNEIDTIDDLFNSVKYMIGQDMNGLDSNGKPLSFLDEQRNGRNPFKTQRMIKMLAEAVAMREVDISDSSILGAGGESLFAYSNPTYISNKISEWKDDDSDLKEKYAKTINKSSRWMHWLLAAHIKNNKEERISLSRQRMDSFQSTIASAFTSKGKDDAVDNKQISLGDQINDNLSKMLKGAHTKGGSIFPTIISADKSRRIEFKGLEYVNSKIFNDKNTKETVIPPDTVGVFVDYFVSEYERMMETSREIDGLPDNEKVVHYHIGRQNGLKSQLFPELSHENLEEGPLRDLLYDSKGKPVNYKDSPTLSDEQKEAVAKHVENSLKKRFNETLYEVEKAIDESYIDKDLVNYYKNNGGNTAMAGDYLINGLISTIEYTKMFSGDPAYYKDNSDLIKRMPATYSDGLQLLLEKNDNLIFNLAVISGVEVSSKYAKLIEDSLSEEDKHIAKAYKKVNTTDAQAWITPRRWKFLKQRLGQWSKNHDEVFKKMYTGETLTQKEMKMAAQPLKGVYFEINNGVPTYLKYSQAVIIPSMVKEGPMKRLLEKMEGSTTVDTDGKVNYTKSAKDEIHEVVTIDGVKVGAIAPSTINKVIKKKKEDGSIDEIGTTELADEFELNSNLMSNKGWKLQQDLPIKTMHETDIGSQVQRTIADSLKIDNTAKYKMSGMTDEQAGSQVLKSLHEATSELITIGAEEVRERLGIVDGINGPKMTDTNSLYKVLIQEFRDRGGNENIISALEKRTKFDAIPQIRGRIDSILMSVFNRAITNISTEGGSYIQVSPFGFESINEKGNPKPGIKIISDNYDFKGLQPPQKGPDGNTLPGQVMIPHTLAIKLLEEAGEDMSRMTQGQLKKFFKDSATRELVGYRIPNQGMSSNDILEIVGILPETMGDSIIAYDGIPAKTGSDFDIDKMYVMAPNLMFNKKDRKFEVISDLNKDYVGGKKNAKKLSAQNKLLSIYKDILKSKHTYSNMMTSIDSKYLKEDIDFLHKKPKSKDLDLFSPVTQLKVKKDYMDGKLGVALTANQLIDHVANQSLNIKFTKDLGLPNFSGEILMDKDPKNGKRISHVLSAFLNAYVDIAKDPYITRGNHNELTAGVSFMLIRAGYSIERVNRIIGQPILKEYIALKRREKSITGKPITVEVVAANGSLSKMSVTPMAYLIKKYGFGKDNKHSVLNLSDISDKRLEKNITGEEKNIFIDEQVLKAFEYFELNSDKWNEAVVAAKVESGSGGSPVDMHVKQNKIKKVIKDGYVQNYESKFKDTFAGKYKELGLDFVSDVLSNSNILLSATPAAKDAYDVLSSQLTKSEILTNLEFGKAVDKGIYSYLMSNTGMMRGNRSQFNRLFVDLPKKVVEMKKDSENFLIKELELDVRGGYSFLGINNQNKPSLYQNNIYSAWMDLYEDPDTKNFSIDLVKYAYSQSGFNSNLSQFFTHIPHEILSDEGLNSDIMNFFTNIEGIQYDENFLDQFARHEHDNKKVVPRMYNGNYTLESIDGIETIVATNVFAKRYIEDGDREDAYPKFVSIVRGGKTSLFKYIGISEKSLSKGSPITYKAPVYAETYKLGLKAGKNKIYEYQYGNEINKSIVPSNNLDSKLDYFEKTKNIVKSPSILVKDQKESASEQINIEKVKSEYEGLFVNNTNDLVENSLDKDIKDYKNQERDSSVKKIIGPDGLTYNNIQSLLDKSPGYNKETILTKDQLKKYDETLGRIKLSKEMTSDENLRNIIKNLLPNRNVNEILLGVKVVDFLQGDVLDNNDVLIGILSFGEIKNEKGYSNESLSQIISNIINAIKVMESVKKQEKTSLVNKDLVSLLPEGESTAFDVNAGSKLGAIAKKIAAKKALEDMKNKGVVEEGNDC